MQMTRRRQRGLEVNLFVGSLHFTLAKHFRFRLCVLRFERTTMGMRAARAARQGGSGDGSGEAVSTEVVLTPSREYLEGKEMLPVLQQALEALSRECSRRGSQQDPRHKVNAIDWLATWLMRNNPSHNAETRAKLAARKNNPKFAIGAGIRGTEVPTGAADAGAGGGAGDDPETRVKITLNDGGGARVAIQTSDGKRNSSDLDAAAALIQGVAGSKLGPSAADLEKAAALIQGVAGAASGPNAADLQAAAALIQGAAASAQRPL